MVEDSEDIARLTQHKNATEHEAFKQAPERGQNSLQRSETKCKFKNTLEDRASVMSLTENQR